MIARTDPRILCLLDSYEHWLGRSLASPETLDGAPFAVLAHGTESPPILWYGNRTALELWEMDFAEFTQMPSYRTAEPDLREARETRLREVQQSGYSTGYRGIRVSRSGRRFEILQATLWNILDPAGKALGQAATFESWRWLSE